MAILKKISENVFLKNVAILASGAGLAQAIALLSIPILSRVYSPEDFGAFAIFISISSFMLVVSLAGMRDIIVIPKRNIVSSYILKFIVISSIFTSAFIFIIYLALKNILHVYFEHDNDFLQKIFREEVYSLFVFLPAMVLLRSMGQALRFWLIRRQSFASMAGAQLLHITISLVVAIALKAMDLVRAPGLGLVLGAVAGELVQAIWLFGRAWRLDRFLLRHARLHGIRYVMKRYWKLAASLSLSQLLATIYTQLPNIVIAWSFGLGAAGVYNMAERLATAPIMLISNAVGDVYRQRATNQYISSGNFLDIMMKTMYYLFIVSAIPYLVLIIYSHELVVIGLGNGWSKAGDILPILLAASLVGFVTTPVDKALVILEDKKFILFINVLRMAMHLIAAAMVYYGMTDFVNYIVLLSLIKVISYIIITGRSAWCANGMMAAGRKP